MKRLLLMFILITISLVAVFGVYANADEMKKSEPCASQEPGERLVNAVSLIPNPDYVPDPNAKDIPPEVTEMETGKKYASLDEYMEKVGNPRKEKDPDIWFVLEYAMPRDEYYVWSNRTPQEIRDKFEEEILAEAIEQGYE